MQQYPARTLKHRYLQWDHIHVRVLQNHTAMIPKKTVTWSSGSLPTSRITYRRQWIAGCTSQSSQHASGMQIWLLEWPQHETDSCAVWGDSSLSVLSQTWSDDDLFVPFKPQSWESNPSLTLPVLTDTESIDWIVFRRSCKQWIHHPIALTPLQQKTSLYETLNSFLSIKVCSWHSNHTGIMITLLAPVHLLYDLWW